MELGSSVYPAVHVWAPAAAAVGGLLLWGAVRWLRRGRNAEVGIRFDLVMPSKWAAELAYQILEAQGTRASLGRDGEAWICRVSLKERFDPVRCEALRAHFHQVAEARGGSCETITLLRENDVVTYEGRRAARR